MKRKTPDTVHINDVLESHYGYAGKKECAELIDYFKDIIHNEYPIRISTLYLPVDKFILTEQIVQMAPKESVIIDLHEIWMFYYDGQNTFAQILY